MDFELLDESIVDAFNFENKYRRKSLDWPDAIDPALRRAGRFDAEIEVTTPTEEERLHILKALCREAAMSAVRKCSDSNLEDDYYSINMDDWKHARSVVGPSITRGVTVEIPKVSWEDIGGLKDIKGILVLGATNRPHAIDAALMRPGRFDLVLYVSPPDLEARFEVPGLHTRDMKLSYDVNIRQIAEDTELFTGAELEGLCREAGIAEREHICNTFKKSLKPALTEEEVVSYSSFMKNSPKRSADSFESSSKKSDKQTKNLLVLASPVIVGVVSVVLYIGVRYFLMPTETLSRELTST
ncbi:hypothetical protein RND71_023603 [Anisodus tanguticus]|uniref:Uncharacterized protein n=1 Tax=Anisodus tanguticus TaxID=243964 RepID=A0AAE1RVW5_9SOLA|nr:hypothetical protein RND71_023603 [Anisodus tanguticus]